MKKALACLLTIGVATSPAYLGGCSGTSNQTKGTIAGIIGGAGVGAAAGDKPGKEKEGAIIGAVIGGVTGAIIGKRMDQQAQELGNVPGVEEVNYDQGSQNIEAKMEILFDVDSSAIKPSEAMKLDELAAVFANYPENIVIIEGHTDSDGSDQYNQTLSEQRAAAIAAYLRGKNLDLSSLTSVGYGESMPVASNSTPEGKAKNRRVEINISVDPNRVPQEGQTGTQ